ncbi:hypothetical protein ACOME3_010825 [Neoechinorhynchus agilis]
MFNTLSYKINYRRTKVACLAAAALTIFSALVYWFDLKVTIRDFPKILIPTQGFTFCCILTVNPKEFKKFNSTYEAWAKECKPLLVIGPSLNEIQQVAHKNEDVIFLNSQHTDHQYLYERTLMGMEYIRDNLKDQCPWILKADDDTFIHTANLEKFLSVKNSSEPIAYGYRFKTHFSGGAGYVISRAALGKVQFRTNKWCTLEGHETGAEDLAFSFCLNSSDVPFGNAVEENGSFLFHPLSLQRFMNNTIPDWMFQMNRTAIKTGAGFCTKNVISFHYVSPEDMLNYKQLIDAFCQ